MGIETDTTKTVICDNPNCPGNELDPHSEIGWLFVNIQTFNEAPSGGMLFPVLGPQRIYCSIECVRTIKISEDTE